MKSLVTIWVLFFLMIFTLGYLTTHLIISKVMADLVVEPAPGITTLEVKEVPKNAVQTDQYTPIQPAVNPIGKEF
jgi:hypothetical protein